MPAVAAGAAIVGAGIGIYGAIKSANDQAALDETRAKIAQQQADEIGARAEANALVRTQVAYRQKLQFGTAFAAAGKAGTGVGSQLQIQAETDLQNAFAEREANFQEKMLHQQAGIDTTLAEQSREAGTINALGSGLSGISGAAGAATRGGANPGYGGKQSLGSYPSGAGSMGGG